MKKKQICGEWNQRRVEWLNIFRAIVHSSSAIYNLKTIKHNYSNYLNKITYKTYTVSHWKQKTEKANTNWLSDLKLDYSLIVSSRLRYSSLVFIVGFRSRMCRASSVSRKPSPRAVCWRMSTSLGVRVVLHLARCFFMGPARWRCSLKRVCICRQVSPT